MRLQLVLLSALLAQASAAGDSCLGRCEEYDRIKDHCQCDMDCEKYHNCCPDYEALCSVTNHDPSPDQLLSGTSHQLRETAVMSDFAGAEHPDTLEMIRPARLVHADYSCSGRCDDYDRYKYKCQCDMSCKKYKNCCPDYETICKKTTHRDTIRPGLVRSGDSCLGRCEEYDRIKDHCQCDMDCEKYHNCCPDYEALCNETTHRDTFKGAAPDMVRPPRLMDALYQKTSTPQANTVNVTTAATTESPNPDAAACSGRPFDSFLQQKNGSIYAFRGDYFFELDQQSVLPGYPKLIKDVWGISGPIDAAFTRINCQGKTYIFKGRKYWRFDNGVLDEDFPRDISVGFDRIPDNVDAAFALPAPGHNGREKVYFFKGDQYHTYEFLHQPSHEECVTMSESSPSTLFRRYTDVYDYYERALTDLFSGLPQHHDKHHFIDKDWRGLKAPLDAAMPGKIYTPMQRSNEDQQYGRQGDQQLGQQWDQQYGRQWGRRRQNRSPMWESMAERGMNMGQSFAERGMEMGLRLAERRMEMEERLGRDRDQDRRRDRYNQNNRGSYDSRDDRSYWEPIQESLPIQSVYFFKGETYSRVDLRTKTVAFASPPYPRSIAKYWLGCPGTAGAEK